MPGQLTGPGVGTPYPQSLYPANLYQGELVPSGNELTLPPGTQIPIPRGRYWVGLGAYAQLQYFDPVTAIWRSFSTSRTGPLVVDSDGFNMRVANNTAVPIGAIVTNGGTNYVQATTTVTPASGTSTWQAIVGGRVNTTVSISASGAGYGVPPLVFIPAPPSPGVQATANAVITSGTLTSITVTNQGAGYTTAPPLSIYPNPTDPNFLAGSTITPATAVAALIGTGNISAILLTNPGVSLGANVVPSLTIGGAGASGAATVVPQWTLQGITVAAAGGGFTAPVELSTVGGTPSGTPAYTNPAVEHTGYIPRKASALVGLTGTGLSTSLTIYDGGLFAGVPAGLYLTDGIVTTVSSVTFALGGTTTTVDLVNLG